MSVQVLAGQTLIDIAMQELGDSTRLYELAMLNNLLPSDDVTPGQLLEVPEVAEDKKNIVKALKIRKPATLSEEVKEQTKEGIGYWGIGVDFIVS